MFFSILLKILFFPSPKIFISQEEQEYFEKIYINATENPENNVEIDRAIPKYKFFHYISKTKDMVLHGSNTSTINEFEPRNQTLFDGTPTKAVFATKDPIWPIFYAVYRRDSLKRNIRNGCVYSDERMKYHFYSLDQQTRKNDPWTKGTVYFLPVKSFKKIGKGKIQFDEWISYDSVKPMLKIEVDPADFYFIDKVSAHNVNESIAKTWFCYKSRVFFK